MLSVEYESRICLVFFNDTATTEIYTDGHTLSLHDALPISHRAGTDLRRGPRLPLGAGTQDRAPAIRMHRQMERQNPDMQGQVGRSEEHTSELQTLMRISYAVF